MTSNSHPVRMFFKGASSLHSRALTLLLGSLLLLGLGCASSQKQESFKELTKLSEDSREEAEKLRREGNPNAALAKYQEALRYHPSPGLHKETGDLLVELERYEEARAQYKLALMKDDNNAEAREAMAQVDARIQLAEGRSRATGVPGPDPLAGTSAPELAGGASLERLDTYDEEDKMFDSMAQIEAPLEPSSGQVGGEPVQPRDRGDLADALMRDSEEIFGVAPSSQPLNEFGTEFRPETASAPRAYSPRPTSDGVGALAAVPEPKTHLAGGRGLLGPARKPSILLANSSGPERSSDFASRPVDYRPDLSAPIQPPDPTALLPEGRPGERGLGSPRRIPEVVDTLPEPKSTNRSGLPSFSTGELEPEPALAEQETSENRGIFANLIDRGDSEISYPDPAAAAAASPDSSALPAPYPEREQIDLTKGIGGGRFAGRRELTLDLETCKRRYWEEKDLEGAVRCFGDKRIDFPDEPLLYYELARIYEDAGSPERAREHYALALRYDPENSTYRQAVAVADVKTAEKLREAGDLRDARDLLLQTVKRFPEMVAAHRELAKVYIQDAQRQESQLGEGGGTEQQFAEIAKAYENAETVYSDVVRLAPDNAKDWYNLGVAVQNQYDDAKIASAIQAYEKCIELDPNYAPAHRNLAILYESRSVDKAVQHHLKALSIARTQSDAESLALVTNTLRDLGSLYWRTGETDKAAQYLTEYLQYVPTDTEVEGILNQITSVPPN